MTAKENTQYSPIIARDFDRLLAIPARGQAITGLVGFASGILGGVCIALLYLNSLRGTKIAARANFASVLVLIALLVVNGSAVRYAQAEAAGNFSGMTAQLSGSMGRVLLAAIDSRDEQLARKILPFTYELDACDVRGRTALHLAADRGMISIVRDIVHQRKQEIDATDADGVTPLMRAAASAQPDIVELLVGAKADVTAHDGSGRTPIHYATSARRTDIAKFLLYSGADIDARDDAGKTALALAYELGDNELFAALIERGARVDNSEGGANLAHEATAEAIKAIERGRDNDAELGVAEIARLRQLLEQGADPNASLPEFGTPLHRVAKAVRGLPEHSPRVKSLGEVAAALVEYGADPARNSGTDELPYDITYAARFGHASQVDELAAKNPESMLRPGLYGKTALVIAVENNQPDVVDVLFAHGANARQWIGAGRNAIETAVLSGNDSLTLELLNKGFAQPTEPSPLGGPLHLAAKEGRVSLLEPLLKAGYKLIAKDLRGNTPLHLASAEGRTEFAMALVDHGADPLSWNNSGETSLSLAESKENKALYTFLKRRTQVELKRKP